MGFVNAVLRKVDARTGGVAHPRNRTLVSRVAAGPLGAPLRRRNRRGIARAALEEPETYAISAAGERIQDIGSQSIVPLLRLEPGQTFLDLCAAPGNKTAQALESGVRRHRRRPALPPRWPN